MLTHIPIGPAVLPSYPFLVLVGIWAGMWLSAREASRLGIDGDHIYNIGLYSLAIGLLGGRFWYVGAHWEAYAGAIGQAFALTANAISAIPAIFIALLTAIVYMKRHQLPLRKMADVLALGAALTLILGSVGAFLGSQTLGTETSIPWGIEFIGAVRHPTHLYLILALVVILGILWKLRLNPRWPGFLFLLFVELYAASWLLLEPFFALPETIGGFRVIQVAALAVMVAVLALMMRLEQTPLSAPGE